MARRFMNKPSDPYVAAVEALRTLAELEGIDSATRAYGESITDLSKQMYEKRRGVKKRDTSHVCVRRLLTGGRCRDSFSNPCMQVRFPAWDHTSEWRKDGRTYSITSEPYGLGYQTIKELVGYCEANGLQMDIDAGSWHFPHRTLLVEVRRADKP